MQMACRFLCCFHLRWGHECCWHRDCGRADGATMSVTPRERFVSSLLGHIVVFEIVWSLPFYLFFLGKNYSHWTPGWAIYSAVMCAVTGAARAAVAWVVVTP